MIRHKIKNTILKRLQYLCVKRIRKVGKSIPLIANSVGNPFTISDVHFFNFKVCTTYTVIRNIR